MKVTKEMLVRDGQTWVDTLRQDSKRYRASIREHAEEIIRLSAGETITSLDEIVELVQDIIRLAMLATASVAKADIMAVAMNDKAVRAIIEAIENM